MYQLAYMSSSVDEETKLFNDRYNTKKEQIKTKIRNIKFKLQQPAKLKQEAVLVDADKPQCEYGTIIPLSEQAVNALNSIHEIKSDDLAIDTGSSLSFSAAEIPHCIIMNESKVSIDSNSKINGAIFDHASDINIKNSFIEHSYLSGVVAKDQVHIKNSFLDGTFFNWKLKCHLLIKGNSIIEYSFITMHGLLCSMTYQLTITNSVLKHVSYHWIHISCYDDTIKLLNDEPPKIENSTIEYFGSYCFVTMHDVTLKPDNLTKTDSKIDTYLDLNVIYFDSEFYKDIDWKIKQSFRDSLDNIIINHTRFYIKMKPIESKK